MSPRRSPSASTSRRRAGIVIWLVVVLGSMAFVFWPRPSAAGDTKQRPRTAVDSIPAGALSATAAYQTGRSAAEAASTFSTPVVVGAREAQRLAAEINALPVPGHVSGVTSCTQDTHGWHLEFRFSGSTSASAEYESACGFMAITVDGKAVNGARGSAGIFAEIAADAHAPTSYYR